jgi:hypothetical protein
MMWNRSRYSDHQSYRTRGWRVHTKDRLVMIRHECADGPRITATRSRDPLGWSDRVGRFDVITKDHADRLALSARLHSGA